MRTIERQTADYDPERAARELIARLKWHSPSIVDVDFVEVLGYVAFAITRLVPAGREQSIAITKLEECVMWCNAALRKEQK